MTLTRVFHTSLYAMVSLAAYMLAYGEEFPFPSGLTIPLACWVLLFHDKHPRLQMNALVGNLLGLAALAGAAVEFFGGRADSRLLAGSHFLVYITWIVMLQAKELRQYWWLCALSLLQVAVGSVLARETGMYGLLLLAYLPLALWTLSVFTLFQGAYELGGLDHERPGGAAPAGDRGRNAGDSLTSLRRRFAVDARSTVRNAIQQDFPGRWIVPRFVVGVLGLAVAGLALGLVMFLFVPRVSFGSGVQFRSEGSRGRALIGFSGEVKLGQIGEILENIERVMRVKIFERVDGINDRSVPIEEFAAEYGLDAPLFRGSVLDQYREGRWSGAESDAVQAHTMPSHPIARGMFRQEYSLDLTGSDFLFAMRPITRARLYDPPGPIGYAYETGAFLGPVEGRNPVEYLVYSKRRSPEDRSRGRNEFGDLPGRQRLTLLASSFCLQLPKSGVEELISRARELTAPERLSGPDTMLPEQRKAQTLVAHLRDSGQYSYSLNMEVQNPRRDPVEEFLLVRKRGHCEYFASALALMLRAVDVPSRLVTGFKGAELHEAGGYYEVQQRHAHVWVEAYIDGEWVVLDPTPGARDEVVRQVGAKAGFWHNARNSISSLWSTYVVSLSLSRQQEALYDPLTGQVSTGWTSIRDVLKQVAGGITWVRVVLSSPGDNFSPKVALWALALLVVVAGGSRLLRRMARRDGGDRPAQIRGSAVRRMFGWVVARLTGRPPEPAGIIVEFSERFLAVMAGMGYSRRNDQTQREFATQVEDALGERLGSAGLGKFPTQLAELFYRVRFGDGGLQEAEMADVETRLGLLATSLRRDRA